ncbi:MAG: PIN domain-containing protein, partial [Actinomycetota bacterium]|nr:PIN domain-containing protein [Actinomycetota bacterium]
MILCDVNVLTYAHKRGAPRHAELRRWLEALVSGESAYGVSDLVLSGFVRVVTLARLWDRPSTLDEALRFVAAVRDAPAAVS